MAGKRPVLMRTMMAGFAGLAVVADACRRGEAACDPWCPDLGGAEFAVEPQPAWLQPLLPPLALASGGPLAPEPLRLLVGDGCAGLSLPDLDRELAALASDCANSGCQSSAVS